MTEEQTALINKARASIVGARGLLQLKLYGFAASRAYYGMFYVARALLLSEGAELHEHSAVIAEFGRLFAKTGRVPATYHRLLIQAQDDRLVGDYDSAEQVGPAEAEAHIDHAEEFVMLAEKLLGSPASKPQTPD